MSKAHLALALILGACMSHNAAAQIYKWVDEDGVVHYSDQPLRDNAEVSDIESGRTAAAAARENLAAANRLRDEQSQAFYRRRAGEDSQEPEQTPEEKEFHRKSCEAARQKLNEFAQARRLYKLLPNGERAYLNEDEILAARAEVQSAITEHCE